jgi:hypothetical protein
LHSPVPGSTWAALAKPSERYCRADRLTGCTVAAVDGPRLVPPYAAKPSMATANHDLTARMLTAGDGAVARHRGRSIGAPLWDLSPFGHVCRASWSAAIRSGAAGPFRSPPAPGSTRPPPRRRATDHQRPSRRADPPKAASRHAAATEAESIPTPSAGHDARGCGGAVQGSERPQPSRRGYSASRK